MVGQMGKTVVVNHGGQLIKVHHQQVKKKVSLTEEVSKNKGNRNKCVEVKEKIGYVRSESEDDSSSESSSSEDSVCSNLPELEGNEPLPEEVAEVLEVSIEEQSYRGEHITEEREVGDQRSVEKDLEENVESEEKTASETDENEEYKSTEEHDDEEGQSDKDVLAAQLLGSWREVTYHSGDHMSLKAGNRITFEDEKGAIQDVVVTSRSGKATGAYYNRFNVKDSITGREYKINLGDETKVSKNTVLIYREEEIALHFVEDDVYAICVPKTRYGEAEILEAMEIELETLKGFNSYEEVHDTGQKCLSTRWIITEKPGRTTGSRIYKARLVCRGFEEEMSNAADSPTADKVDLRLFLSLASTFGWSIKTVDVKAAFLQSEKFDRTVFVKPPKSIKKQGVIWSLLKPLYGLSDSCRKWYFTLKNALCEVGLKMSQYDKAMFYLFDTKLQGVVIIHVDDLLYAGTTKFQDMMKKISQRFKISKSEQGAFRYIGMDLSSNQNEINLSQKSYCSLVQMVKIDYERKKQTEKDLTEDEIKMYQSLLGKLNWLACNSRPDLKFEVFLHAQFKKPKVKQLISLNKVVKQLVGGPEKIIFPKLDVANLRLLCYTDASLGNLENNVRSCKAFVIFLADRERCGALAWNSKKIDRICDNTLEAEARALKYGMTYAIAIRYTLELRFLQYLKLVKFRVIKL